MARTIDILLVEDNPNDVELALYAFRQNGIEERVRITRDGEEALEFLQCRGHFASRQRSEGPAIVLLDLKLPKVDGFQVIQTIRSDEHLRTLPVIALTTSNELSDIHRCYALGVNSYILKPVEFDRFSHAIRSIIQYWFTLNQLPVTR
ncbi:MAG: response regulator [Bacteroidetes bacterium]|nr:response regulator [Bacteroidota bacterium]